MLLPKLAAVLAFPFLAVATPWATTATTPSAVTKTVTVTETATTTALSQCNTSNIQCCTSTVQASSTAASTILGLLGVVLQDVDNVLVGLTCSPITILSIDAGGCAAEPVCCENNNFAGLISIGCVPINISL
ncbi:hypothetical protein M0805_004470 [Coniferiporia weirii]|nr:hypothetical protein M0805_004470 [Coniferiporia weirii]